MEEEECECDEGAPAWMATFSDLATLLLTFFVLLLSFAEMDITEFKTMLGSIREAFGVYSYDPGPHHAASTSPIEIMDNPSYPMALSDEERNLLRAIRRYIRDNHLEDQVEVMAGESGVIVRMKDNVLFDTGSAVVKPEGLPILIQIGQLASAFPEGLSIEGHTDDRPINTSRFPSNWELSTARATESLRTLRQNVELDVARLQVVGYADTVPLVPNDTDEHRSTNRRVEFVFRRTAPRRIEFTDTDELDEDESDEASAETEEDAAGETESTESSDGEVEEAAADESPANPEDEPEELASDAQNAQDGTEAADSDRPAEAAADQED